MKTTLPLTLAAILLSSVGIADAGIFGRRRAPEPPPPPRHEDRHDHRHDHRNDYRGKDRLERRVQFRLRELGFYRGPIDGEFGRGSRAALMRFQASRGIRPTGTFTPSTIRALRL